ncbi:hypothetical protein ACIQMV_32460 [Streptomyces sp. NPDC091412]|uniref:hypothetical protein n=1 Tax=Streptomyces sp. NPDC091412 TaxID=3366002 RepID=UPI003804711E
MLVRETARVLKQLTTTGKQVQGTVRPLKAQGVQMVNERSRSVRIDSPAIDCMPQQLTRHAQRRGGGLGRAGRRCRDADGDIAAGDEVRCTGAGSPL